MKILELKDWKQKSKSESLSCGGLPVLGKTENVLRRKEAWLDRSWRLCEWREMSIALTLKIISFNLICVYHIFVDNIEVGIVLKK